MSTKNGKVMMTKHTKQDYGGLKRAVIIGSLVASSVGAFLLGLNDRAQADATPTVAGGQAFSRSSSFVQFANGQPGAGVNRNPSPSLVPVNPVTIPPISIGPVTHSRSS